MLDLGVIRPGSTIRIPFSSFDKDDGSSVTMTNYSTADLLVYKDGSTTERASTNGYTATTDFDGKTGKHLAILDLSDNTTAGFWNSGSEYLVAVDAVTIDGVTTGGWIARFTIGYRDATINTTIATLSSQTSFTLTLGPAEDNALLGCVCAIHSIASAVQVGFAVVSAYTGATKTVTLTAGVSFTAAAGDNISFFPPGNARWFAALLAVALPLTPTTAGRTLVVDANGLADANMVKVGPTGSGTTQTAGDIMADTNDIQTRLPAALVSGRMDSSTGAMAANVLTATAINADAITAAKVAADVGTEIGTAVWATAARELTALDEDNTTIDLNGSAVGSVVGSVGSVTGAVGSVTGAVGSVTGAVGSVTGNVGGNVTGSVGSLAAQAKADVNAEALDVLNVDTYAEPAQGAPGATITLAAKINFLFKAWRNKSTQTASTYSLFNDDAATVDHKAAVSDDATTLTRGEIAAGP